MGRLRGTEPPATPATSPAAPPAVDPRRAAELYENVLRRVTGSTDIDDLLRSTARLLAEALDADAGLAFRVDARGDLQLVAEPGGAAFRLPRGFGVIGRVAADAVPAVLVDDTPRNADHRRVLGLADDERVSRLVVPSCAPGGQAVAVLAVHQRRRREFSPDEVGLAGRCADLVATRVALARSAAEAADHHARWESVVAATVAAQEAERRRVAADLHDGVTQAIASMTFHLSAVQLALADGDTADALAQLDEAQELASLAFGEARSAITGLRSPVLDDLGLAAALASLARSMPVPVDVEADDLDLPEHVSVSLFRIAQEALTNAVRHARASEVRVRLERRGPSAVLSVDDDGRGMAEDRPGEAEGSYGLAGMTERAHLIGGELRVTSAPGEGTAITVSVPLTPPLPTQG